MRFPLKNLETSTLAFGPAVVEEHAHLKEVRHYISAKKTGFFAHTKFTPSLAWLLRAAAELQDGK